MGIVVIGAVFVDVKGYPEANFIPTGRNAGRVEHVHGGVARNVVEDIANMELRPTFVSIVDDTPMGSAVLEKLKNHKVNVDYVQTIPDGTGGALPSAGRSVSSDAPAMTATALVPFPAGQAADSRLIARTSRHAANFFPLSPIIPPP